MTWAPPPWLPQPPSRGVPTTRSSPPLPFHSITAMDVPSRASRSSPSATMVTSASAGSICPTSTSPQFALSVLTEASPSSQSPSASSSTRWSPAGSHWQWLSVDPTGPRSSPSASGKKSTQFSAPPSTPVVSPSQSSSTPSVAQSSVLPGRTAASVSSRSPPWVMRSSSGSSHSSTSAEASSPKPSPSPSGYQVVPSIASASGSVSGSVSASVSASPSATGQSASDASQSRFACPASVTQMQPGSIARTHARHAFTLPPGGRLPRSGRDALTPAAPPRPAPAGACLPSARRRPSRRRPRRRSSRPRP